MSSLGDFQIIKKLGKLELFQDPIAQDVGMPTEKL